MMHTMQRPRRRTHGFEYRVYFALVFLISLPVALVRRLLPVRPGPYGARRRRSVIGEALSMADSVTPMLFSA
jgi:hypothetical protein